MFNLCNCRAYVEAFLKIRTKDQRVVPLRLNTAQEKLYSAIRASFEAGRPGRFIILKARQLGFSTITEAVLFQRTATRPNVSSLIAAHREDSTANLYAMTRLFYDELPPPIKPMVKNSNARELVFENPTRYQADKKARPGLRSKIRCVTAGGSGIGRSDTIHNAHLSEYAFWRKNKRETLLGILQAVPGLPGTLVVIESTANGFDDFKRLWDAACSGESDFVPLFFPWFENPEYRMAVPEGTQWSDEELALMAQYDLSGEQLMWRRWCIRTNCSGDVQLFRQEYPSAPEEAFLLSGRPVFDNEIVLARMKAAPEPIARGRFAYDYDGLKISNIRWLDEPVGEIALYQRPQKGHPYVIGGDTAGEGSDWFTGQVIDNSSGRQVAVLRHQYDEDLYAKQMYCLGMYYNRALIGIEANYSTYPIKELMRLEYPRQYVREVEDTYSGQLKRSYGFVTSRITKPIIVSQLVEIVRDSAWAICDKGTLGEMLTYQKLEEGGTGAMEGENDDLVMALAVAYYVRTQQDTAVSAGDDGKRVKWTADMWEDWRRASADGKRYLESKWGKPR